MATTFSPSSDVILTEVGDGTAVLLHLVTKFYYTLNATGLAAWKALDEGATLDAIASRITHKFRIDAETAARDVEPILKELVVEGLVARSAA